MKIGVFRNTFEQLKNENFKLSASAEEIEFEKNNVPKEFWDKISCYLDEKLYKVSPEKVKIVVFALRTDLEMLEDFSLIN